MSVLRAPVSSTARPTLRTKRTDGRLASRHAAAVVNCPREPHSSSPRLVCCVLDAPTVLLGGFVPPPPSEKTPEGRRVSRVAEEERLERVKGQSNVRVCCRAVDSLAKRRSPITCQLLLGSGIQGRGGRLLCRIVLR